MNIGTWAGGAVRRMALGVAMVCLWSQIGVPKALGQPADPPADGTGLIVVPEAGELGAPTVYRLVLTGDPATAGPLGAFYRTLRPISYARVIEVDEVDPPEGV